MYQYKFRKQEKEENKTGQNKDHIYNKPKHEASML